MGIRPVALAALFSLISLSGAQAARECPSLSDARLLTEMRPQVDALKWNEVMRELTVLGVQLGTGRPETVHAALGKTLSWQAGEIPKEFSVCAKSRRPKGSHVLFERFLDRPGVDYIIASLQPIESQSDCKASERLNGAISVGSLKLGSDLDTMEDVLGLAICQDDQRSIYLFGRNTPLRASLMRREQLDIEVRHPRERVVSVLMRYSSQDDSPAAGSRRGSGSSAPPFQRSAPSSGGAR